MVYSITGTSERRFVHIKTATVDLHFRHWHFNITDASQRLKKQHALRVVLQLNVGVMTVT